MLSILHRMTGAGLSLGLIVLAWWLVAAAYGPASYQIFTGIAGSWYGQIFLLGWSVALFYHLANGIRHLFWDAGFLFELKNAYAAGYFVLAFTVFATVLAWLMIYYKLGFLS